MDGTKKIVTENFQNLKSTVKGLYFGANWVSSNSSISSSSSIYRVYRIFPFLFSLPDIYHFGIYFLYDRLLNGEKKFFFFEYFNHCSVRHVDRFHNN